MGSIALEHKPVILERKMRKMKSSDVENYATIQEPDGLGLMHSETDRTKISVIVVCNGEKERLKDALDSVLNQTLQEIEVICLHDSTLIDLKLNIIESYKQKDSRIKVLSLNNQNVIRNRSVFEANGKYVYLMDSNGYLDITALEKLYLKCEEEEVDVCLFKAKSLNLENNKSKLISPLYSYIPREEIFSASQLSHYESLNIHYPVTSNRLYRKSFIEEKGLRWQNIGATSDLFFCLVSLYLASKVSVIDEILYTKVVDSNDDSMATKSEGTLDFVKKEIEDVINFFRAKGVYEEHKISILARCITSGLQVLETTKTRESFIETIVLLKLYFSEMKIDRNIKAIMDTLMLEDQREIAFRQAWNALFIVSIEKNELRMSQFNSEVGLLERPIQQNLDDYLKYLRQEKNKYTIILCTKSTKTSAPILFDEDQVIILQELGISKLILGTRFIAILNDEKSIVEISSRNEESIIYQDEKYDILSSSTEANVFLNENELNYSANKEGLNIILIEKMSDKVVESVSFDLIRDNRLTSILDIKNDYKHFIWQSKVWRLIKGRNRKQIEENIKNDLWIPLEILEQASDYVIDEKSMDESFQKIYTEAIIKTLSQVEKPDVFANDEQGFKGWLLAIYNVLQLIDSEFFEERLNKTMLNEEIKTIILNFSRTGNLEKASNIYSVGVQGETFIALDQNQMKVIIPELFATIYETKAIGSSLKLTGKISTVFDLYNFNVYFENSDKQKMPVELGQYLHDQQKILDHVVVEPFSFSSYLPQTFLSSKTWLIVQYKENKTKKIGLKFKGKQATIDHEIPGSHVHLSNGLIYYHYDSKSLRFTSDNERIEYLKLLSIFNQTKDTFTVGDLDLAAELQPYVKKELSKKEINLFLIGKIKNVSERTRVESFIKYKQKYQNGNEENYFIVDKKTSFWERLKQEGFTLIDRRGVLYLKLLLASKRVYLYEPSKFLKSTHENLHEVLPEPFELITPWDPWSFVNMRHAKSDAEIQYAGKQVNLFMDRLDKADDNATTLITYFEANKMPNELNYFVLNKNCIDTKSLKEKGILVAHYGSYEHLSLLMIAKNLITSHLFDSHVSPFKKLYGNKINHYFNYRINYIQSGIINSDLSNQLRKTATHVDLLITSGQSEFERLRSLDYEYTDEVVLTGLPRFDRLEKTKGKIILIAPAWNQDSSINDIIFPGGDYFSKWDSLLVNNTLIKKANDYGYEVAYLPHPMIKGMINCTDQIRVVEQEEHFVDIINSASCLITDRNSIHNDFAYAEKQVIYYCPSEIGLINQDYFSYETDGFGPVMQSESDLVDAVIASMEKGFEVEQEYIDRKNNFFSYTDQNNSKRVYEAIKMLDEKNQVIDVIAETAVAVKSTSKHLTNRQLSVRIKSRLKRMMKKVN